MSKNHSVPEPSVSPGQPSNPPEQPWLGMGCWAFGGDYWKPVDSNTAKRTVRKALEFEIKHFDTAPAYGNGRSEQLLGQILHKEVWKSEPEKRDDIVLSSKFFPTLPENVFKGLKRSLGRLLTGYMDICFIHWPNDKCDLPGIMGELERAREEGLIKSIGVSNFSVKQMEDAGSYGRIDYCQTGYSLLWRYPEEEIIPWCAENGVRVIAYSPLAQGLLKSESSVPEAGTAGTAGAGAISAVAPEDSRRKLVFFRNEELLAETLSVMTETASAEGLSLTAGALGWLKRKAETEKVLTGVFSGMRSPLQARELADYWSNTISDALAEKLEEVSGDYNRKLRSACPEAENIWDHKR